MVSSSSRSDVRRVGPEDWRTYRDLRLAALIDSPRAFWTPYARAAEAGEEHWRDRLQWPTFIAYRSAEAGPGSVDPELPPAPVGLVALWHAPGAPDSEISLVQMWVATWARGAGVAADLIEAALTTARSDGWSRVTLMVVQPNEPAIHRYRKAGFRATGHVRALLWSEQDSELEMAVELGPSGQQPSTRSPFPERNV